MRKLIIILGLIYIMGNEGKAQQLPMFTQYAYNTLAINPAFAGTKDGIDFLLLNRWQWVDYEGAPNTFNFNSSFKVADKVGMGVNFVNDKIGVSTTNTMQLAGSYMTRLNEKLTLSFGLALSTTSYKHDWNNISLQNPSDPTFGANNENLTNINAGFGLYLYSDKYYVSFSIPYILENKITNTSEAQEYRHYFLKGGVHFNLSENVDFVPSALLKYVTNNDVQLDITATFILQKMLWLGATYRSQDGFALMAQLDVKKRFRIGYGYDIPVTDIQTATSGSHEIILGFNIKSRTNNVIVSPRYF
ncbi:type IX secretion system membrane protein PorP/SprF [Flammeovirga sp. EKP202]|uniref:PorP/SprF family type IX secretion system membrane protein n=1 Tax=Flammeovirga sp. EKP202 TaxID=2770592 RepID=UPI00165EE02A|nr:type IX secretion system membrane protein PorP/SprF [Flammeovirga sp. EKP202]MBD0401391.1 type IX secretion system membrane protein PorP/SprF [Flammeovirga sp. EKP202]